MQSEAVAMQDTNAKLKNNNGQHLTQVGQINTCNTLKHVVLMEGFPPSTTGQADMTDRHYPPMTLEEEARLCGTFRCYI